MIYIGLDGIGASLIERTDLNIKRTHRLVRLTSNFPTNTNIALGRLFNFISNGYEPEIFFDRKKNKRRNFVVKQLFKSDKNHYGYYFDYRTNILLYGLSFLFPEISLKVDLKKLREFNGRLFFSSVSDAVGHRNRQNELEKLLKEFDKAILERFNEDEVIMFSDHGMIGCEENLKKAYLNDALKFLGIKNSDLYFDCPGLLNAVPLHYKSRYFGCPGLAQAFCEVEGVEMVLERLPDSVEIFSKEGYAKLRVNEKKIYDYRAVSFDVLGYGEKLVIGDRESYEEFCDHKKYPDALKRINDSFNRKVVKNVADLIVVLKKGYCFTNNYISKLFGRDFKATHGSLRKECSEAFCLVPNGYELESLKKNGSEYMRIDKLRVH